MRQRGLTTAGRASGAGTRRATGAAHLLWRDPRCRQDRKTPIQDRPGERELVKTKPRLLVVFLVLTLGVLCSGCLVRTRVVKDRTQTTYILLGGIIPIWVDWKEPLGEGPAADDQE